VVSNTTRTCFATGLLDGEKSLFVEQYSRMSVNIDFSSIRLKKTPLDATVTYVSKQLTAGMFRVVSKTLESLRIFGQIYSGG
jgi:hypothetical protein